MIWSYGVTTVPERINHLLPRTLESLAKTGFDKPRLFVDGCSNVDTEQYSKFGLEITLRNEKVRTFVNWYLAAWELYLRTPNADRYAIFQDDFICCLNIKSYLEQCPYPDKGYLNLYTFPQNEPIQLSIQGRESPPNPSTYKGWYKSNQLGKSAIGLVFSNEAIRTLLTHPHMVERVKDIEKGWKKVDGGIVTAMTKAGWYEYVHTPSLTQHTGYVSSMGNRHHQLAYSFSGEEFDATSLLCT